MCECVTFSSFTALRGRQGNRVMYVLLPTVGQLVGSFGREIEPHDERSQRALSPAHAKGIADYVTENRDDYVLGSLTYAVDQEGEFRPFVEGANIGELRLARDAVLRSVDGQHRRVGLQEALTEAAELAQESVAVVLYVEDDLQKRRQMFSDMNWTARKVSASQNVAFDSRDPISRVVRRLLDGDRVLQARVEKEQARVPRDSAKLYTLGATYDAVRRLQLGPEGRARRSTVTNEPHLLDRSRRFFAVLMSSRPELSNAHSPEEVAALRRNSLLASSTTLRVVAGAFWICIEKWRADGVNKRLEDLQGPLAEVDFRPDADLWVTCGYVTPGKQTPNARAQEVRYATNMLAGELLELRPAALKLA